MKITNKFLDLFVFLKHIKKIANTRSYKNDVTNRTYIQHTILNNFHKTKNFLLNTFFGLTFMKNWWTASAMTRSEVFWNKIHNGFNFELHYFQRVYKPQRIFRTSISRNWQYTFRVHRSDVARATPNQSSKREVPVQTVFASESSQLLW